MNHVLRVIVLILCLSVFGIGCEYYDDRGVQTVAYSKERAEIQDLQEQIKSLQDQRAEVITAPQGNDGSDTAIIAELERRIEELSRELDAAAGADDAAGGTAGVEIPDARSDATGDDTSAGTTGSITGGGTTGGTTGGMIDVFVLADDCRLIGITHYRCFESADSSYCTDLFGNRTDCPTDSTPTCRNDAPNVLSCREKTTNWCIDATTFKRLAECPSQTPPPAAEDCVTTQLDIFNSSTRCRNADGTCTTTIINEGRDAGSTTGPCDGPPATSSETTVAESNGTVHVFSINATNQVVHCKGPSTGSWSDAASSSNRCATLSMKSQTPITTLYQPKKANSPADFPDGGVIHVFGTNGNWLTYAYCPASGTNPCQPVYQDKSTFPMQNSPSAVVSNDGTIYLFSLLTGEWNRMNAVAIKGLGRQQGFGKINTDPNNLMASMMTSDQWRRCGNINTGVAAALTRDASGKERIDVFSSSNMIHMWLADLAYPSTGWQCSVQNTNSYFSSRPKALVDDLAPAGTVHVFAPSLALTPTRWSILNGVINNLAIAPWKKVFTSNAQTIPAVEIAKNGDTRTVHYFYATADQKIGHASSTYNATQNLTSNNTTNPFSSYAIQKDSQPGVAIDPEGNISVFAVKEPQPGGTAGLIRYTNRPGTANDFTEGEIIESNIMNNSFSSPAVVFTPEEFNVR